jgi:S-adenosylmethionine:tRNA ribosyltransferase-isomerase
MDSEELKITQEACDIVNDAKVKKTYLCSGTTSMRAESSVSSLQNTLNPLMVGQTNLFSSLMISDSNLYDY